MQSAAMTSRALADASGNDTDMMLKLPDAYRTDLCFSPKAQQRRQAGHVLSPSLPKLPSLNEQGRVAKIICDVCRIGQTRIRNAAHIALTVFDGFQWR